MSGKFLSVTDARLPETYQAAKTALTSCVRVDECQKWANQAEALASYARQSRDDSMRKLCDRIQARAVRRSGELLRQVKAAKPGPKIGVGAHTELPSGRIDAGERAGMSRYQTVTALRVASIPAEEFEAAVESNDPPTVTALAEQGRATRNYDPDAESLGDLAAVTRARGVLRRAADFAGSADNEGIVRGSETQEHVSMLRDIATVRNWIDDLQAKLERAVR